MRTGDRHIDFFADDEIKVCFSEDSFNEILTIGFWIKDSVYDTKNDCAVIPADKLKIAYDEDGYDEDVVKKVKKLNPDYLEIRKVRERSLHYAV